MNNSYPARPDPSTNQNLDSLKYKYHLASPKTFPGQFRSHIDLVSTTPPKFDDTWVTLSQSGTTTKVLAVAGSGFSYSAPDTNDLVHRVVHEGAICLVNPGPPPNTWVVSVPRNDTAVSIKSSGGEVDPLDRTHGTDREGRV